MVSLFWDTSRLRDWIGTDASWLKGSLMNWEKVELLAPLVCSSGNDLFLKDRRHLGLAHHVPEPLCHGDCRVADLTLKENDLIHQDSNGFLPDTQKLVHTNMSGCGLRCALCCQLDIEDLTWPKFLMTLEKPKSPLGFFFPLGKWFSSLLAVLGVSLPLTACVCAPLLGIISLPSQQGPRPSVTPSTLTRC